VIGGLLVGPRDPIRIDTFRVLTGVSMIGFVAQWWFDDAAEWLTTEGFHLSPVAAGPEWLTPPPLPVWALAPFGILCFGAMLAFTLGIRLRLATPLTLLLLLYLSHVDPLASFTPHDLYIVTLAILTVSARGCYWTLDRVPVRPISVWPLRILQATLMLAYLCAGVAKIATGSWLANPFALREHALGAYRTELAAWLLRNLPDSAWSILQSLALAFELLAPALFASRRFRILGFVWGAGMHLGIGLMMDEFGWFALQMVAFYALFMDESTLHAIRNRAAGLGRRQLPGTRAAARAAPGRGG
jgi:hypothetical protein